tara:strand:- start:1291 stop:1770 length:480 start_codon:yes stop_codon:yes gene_type:complete
MKVQRFFKRCEEFSVCSEFGEKGACVIEPAEERRTLYQIVIRGSGRMAKTFDSEYLEGDSKNKIMTDLRKFKGQDTIFEAYEDFHMFGFNTLTLGQNWDGKLISGSFMGNDEGWLICFDGEPVINGKELQALDYAKLENKWYNVDINDSVVGVFTKIGI